MRTKFSPNKKTKSKAGQPTAFKFIYCEQAKLLCKRFGATNEQLAEFFKIHHTTIQNWQETYRKFFIAIREGRDQHDTLKIERSLKDRALGYEYDEVSTETVELKGKKNGKAIIMPAIKTRTRHVIVPPNVTAAIFWLVNRTRFEGRWANIQNVISQVNIKKEEDINVNLTGVTTEKLRLLRGILEEAITDSESESDGGKGIGTKEPEGVYKTALALSRN